MNTNYRNICKPAPLLVYSLGITPTSMLRTILLLSLALPFSFSLLIGQYTPGQTYFGTDNFIEYHAGDLPIIVSAPHGGYLSPGTIPNRNCSACVTVRDSRTEEMAYQIDSAIQVLFGGHPHIIINKLARTKLDANREIVEAAQGNAQAETAWTEYHSFIQSAKNQARGAFGSVLYIDLHGHGHTIQRLELGYLLSRAELQNSNADLDAVNFQDSSSIKHLSNVLNPGASFAEILRGSDCMGEFLVEHGFPSTPSATDTAPAPADPYFSGGYNTVRHGSRASSEINGIQFELNWTGVRDNADNRSAFSRGLACAIRDYLDRWFFDVDAWVPGHLVTSTADHGPGTLRDALLGAEDGDVVTFAASLNGDTIRLEKELRICTQVTVQGPGFGLLAVSGGDSTRLIRIMKTDSAVIRGLSLVRGNSPGGEDGGGLLVEGTVRLASCKLADNYADDDGGGLSINENGVAYLDSCTISNNSCGDDGGGLRNFLGTLAINHTTVSGNSSPSFGGGLSSNGTVKIEASTFTQNQANSVGGGMRSFGGSVSILNSTFEGNTSGDRAGGISTSIDIDLNFCTLVNNTATNTGGGIRSTGANCTLQNTLIAKNTSPTGPDVAINGGAFVSNGYNFIGDSTGSAWLSATADQLGNSVSPIDPLILPLTNNGGPTPTVALSPSSPCVDLANSSGAPATDQRGQLRISNGQADIGAFEYYVPVHLLADEIANDFKLYPNPGRNLISYEFSKRGNYELTVGNMLGQIIWQTAVRDAQDGRLDVSTWAEGTYWIRVNGDLSSERIFMVR
jgi:N-formylglutamate amidohydrolase